MKEATVRVIAALMLIAPLAACHQTEIGRAVGFPKPDKPQQFQNGR
jgi:hypothetical protein